MGWIKYALITACVLAAADLCVKLAANRISSSLLMFIYGCCTFSTGLSWVLWQWARGIPQHVQISGVLASVGMGFAFSGVTIGLYVTFSAGAPISLGSPVIRFGGILLTSLAGLILLREPLTLRYILGVLLVCSGMYLVITR